MDSDRGPEVIIQLQPQTSTLNLSDNEFAVKTAGAAARIKAFQSAQIQAANKALVLASATGRLSTIAEVGHIDQGQPKDITPAIDDISQMTATSSPQTHSESPLAHPGKLVPLQFSALLENNDTATLSDTASDVTAKPSCEIGNAPTDSTFDLTTQFAIKQTDGSYKDVDMREIAPWLYQEDIDAQQSRPKLQTPPSSLGRASRAGRLVHSKTTNVLGDIDDDDSTVVTPKTITPGDRKSSLKSVFSPSPTSSLRRISSKLSFANLRKPSFKLDTSLDPEFSSQLGRSFPSPTAEHDSDSSNSTIGCLRYEDHTYGPAPRIDHAEDIDNVRSRRGFRPLSVITSAINYSISPFPPMDTIVEPGITNEVTTGMRYHDTVRNTSTETVILAPKHKSQNRGDSCDSDECAVTFSSSEDAVATIHGDASTLFNTPPPLLSDHPINREDENAFKVRTDYPLMTTSTPAPIIKALAEDMNQLSSKSAGFVDDLRKKKSYRNLGGLLPRSAPLNRLACGSELSPVVAAMTTALTRTSNDSARTTPSLTKAPTCESDDSRGRSLRKISTFFIRSSKDSDSTAESLAAHPSSQSLKKRSKVKGHQISADDKSGQASMEISKRKRKQHFMGIPAKSTESEHFYLEQFIRNHLAYHHKAYKPGKWPHYPPHPNNLDRAWDHANLRCKLCIEDFCGCCGKACCAHHAVNLRLSLFSKESEDNNGLKEMLAQVFPDPKVRPNPRELTKELKDALDSLRPAVAGGKILGGESQTFLQCTECKKMTCPSCCGICPVDGCGDTLCRKCKAGDPWSPCNWHEKGQESGRIFESKECTEENSSTSPMSPLALALRKEWIDNLEEKYIAEETKGGPRAFWRHKA